MSNESVKTRLTPFEKVMSIIDKIDSDREVVELWQDVGRSIHKRVDEHRKESEELQKKLPTKES